MTAMIKSPYLLTIDKTKEEEKTQRLTQKFRACSKCSRQRCFYSKQKLSQNLRTHRQPPAEPRSSRLGVNE